MGKNKQTHTKAGSNTHSSTIKTSTKLLFQILQCVHHLTNLSDSREGIKAKAFQKKQKELDKFVRPAQEHPNSEFRGAFRQLTSQYISGTLALLRTHYLASMKVLCIKIQNLGISHSDLQTSSKIALRWGRKNFGSKLTTVSIKEFHKTVQACFSDPRHDPNLDQIVSTHLQPSNSVAQQRQSGSPHFSSSPAPQALTFSTSLPHPPSVPQPPTPAPLPPPSPPALSPPSSPPPSHPPTPTVLLPPATPSPPSPPSPTVTVPSSSPTPFPPPTPRYRTRSTVPSLLSLRPTPTLSPLGPSPQAPLPHSSTTPSTPLPSLPSSPPSAVPPSAPGPPPFSTPSSSHPSFKGLFDPNIDPIDVQGPGNSLSNFYPCSISSKGQSYRSVEHAYHHSKAVFLRREDLSTSIRSAPNAKLAKDHAKPMRTDPSYHLWEKKEKEVLWDLWSKKSEQIPTFRSDLLSTYPRRITHNVRDKKWGSTHQRDGRVFQGQDHFAKLLMEFRHHLLVESGYFGIAPSSPTPTPSTSGAPLPSTPTTPSFISTNRFSALQVNDLNFPALSSPSVPIPTPPPRQSRSGPKIFYHKPLPQGKGKRASTNSKGKGPQKHREWNTPSCTSKVVFLGDSNLGRITKKPSKPVDSLEIHSYSGAKIRHFSQSICSDTSVPQRVPEHVVLSVGINDRHNNSNTHRDQVKKMISRVTRTFPNAQIHIPLLNHSFSNESLEGKSLKSLNLILQELAASSKFHLIPQIHPSKFSTSPTDQIHWLADTANDLQDHWIAHLN